MNHRAFTLIELLIVVAIIAILAAIAVPNFLEAQTRAKIARCKSDLRTVDAGGLMPYQLDHNTFPLMNSDNTALLREDRTRGSGQYDATLERLSTPVAYLAGRGTFTDPFKAREARRLDGSATPNLDPSPAAQRGFGEYFYAVRGTKGNSSTHEHLQWGDANAKVSWGLLQAAGPKGQKWYFGAEVNLMNADTPQARGACLDIVYDATNGTMSSGAVPRVFGIPVGRGSVLGKAVQGATN